MSSISSFIATVISVVLALAGSTGPVDANPQLSQPDNTETAQVAQEQ